MVVGTRPDFPLLLRPDELDAGFAMTQIDNPYWLEPGQFAVIMAVVCMIDVSHRVLKRLAADGKVVYHCRRRPTTSPSAAPMIPPWETVLQPFTDPLQAVQAARGLAGRSGPGQRAE